jgi:hypothetical protein
MSSTPLTATERATILAAMSAAEAVFHTAARELMARASIDAGLNIDTSPDGASCSQWLGLNPTPVTAHERLACETFMATARVASETLNDGFAALRGGTGVMLDLTANRTLVWWDVMATTPATFEIRGGSRRIANEMPNLAAAQECWKTLLGAPTEPTRYRVTFDSPAGRPSSVIVRGDTPRKVSERFSAFISAAETFQCKPWRGESTVDEYSVPIKL